MSGCRAFALILSLLCLGSAAAASSSERCPSVVAKLSFKKSHRCPTTAASLLPQKLTSDMECVAICSRLPTCNAFHFDKNTGQCFHGDACSQLEQWTAGGDCDSYKYTDVLCGDCDVAEPVLTELKLKLFYKFSRSGLKNEVNPRQFCLTAHDVTVDAGGAHFQGNSGSYLSTETPGFWELFKLGAEFSAFVRVKHIFGTGIQYYYKFSKCGVGYGNSFIKNGDKVSDSARSVQGGSGVKVRSFSPSFLPIDGLQREVSVGFSFNGTGLISFYLNGSISGVGSVTNDPMAYSQSLFDCLSLGQSSTDSYCLNGIMFCYGFSTKALNLSEFQQVQELCYQD